MPRSVPDDQWTADAAARFADLAAWRRAHPRATWGEIEAALDARLGPLRARVLADTVLASDAVDAVGDAAACPACGERLIRGGSRRRVLRGEDDQLLALDRQYARCPRCGTGLFPPR